MVVNMHFNILVNISVNKSRFIGDKWFVKLLLLFIWDMLHQHIKSSSPSITK